MVNKWENNEEIQLFREYLRIPSVHPDVDYTSCVDFLSKQGKNLGLSVEVSHPGGPKKPVVIMTWLGQQPDLPSIMLSSHMDVVPVFPEKWTHPPFGAEMDEEGRIYARGAQDMKSVGMQYLGAIRALKRKGITLKRTIHITFVPDEEIGGEYGMKIFAKTEKFQKLNVGFSLDEGVATPTDILPLFYAEKNIWQVEFIISGNSGHGSILLNNTVGPKLQYILNKMMDLREKAVKLFSQRDQNVSEILRLGDLDTINLTIVKGGVQNNVIPEEIRAVFDIRLSLNSDVDDWERMFKKWCAEAGGGITINSLVKDQHSPSTDLNDSNPFWVQMRASMEKMGIKFAPGVLPGISDNRFVRQEGIPALGFSPMSYTPLLAHDHNEYLKAETYLKGIEIYENLVTAIANT